MTDYTATTTTYGTTTPVWSRTLTKAGTRDVTLDADAFLDVHPDGVVPSGTTVALDNDDHGVPAVPDGPPAIGHLLNETRVAPGRRPYVAVLHAGTVTERLLPGGAVTQAIRTALTRITYL